MKGLVLQFLLDSGFLSIRFEVLTEKFPFFRYRFLLSERKQQFEHYAFIYLVFALIIKTEID
jgi:hypothetical protein